MYVGFYTQNFTPGLLHPDFYTRTFTPGLSHQDLYTQSYTPELLHLEFLTGGRVLRELLQLGPGELLQPGPAPGRRVRLQ
jgi:hypothetical protein